MNKGKRNLPFISKSEHGTIMKCQGYTEGHPLNQGGCNREATPETDFCDPCGDAKDWDVASDFFKDDHGFRPLNWADVNDAREYMENRNELAFAEDFHTDEWGDETVLEA